MPLTELGERLECGAEVSSEDELRPFAPNDRVAQEALETFHIRIQTEPCKLPPDARSSVATPRLPFGSAGHPIPVESDGVHWTAG